MIACVRDYYNVNDLQIRVLQYANDWMGGYNGDLLFIVHKAVDYIDKHDDWLKLLLKTPVALQRCLVALMSTSKPLLGINTLW